MYPDGRGGWYLKVSLGRDPLTGRRSQVTWRGYRTATEAGKARREMAGKAESGQIRPTSSVLTIGELLDLYLDGLDADARLSAKTRFDYRHYADNYVRPLLAAKKVWDLTPDAVVAWQRALSKSGGTKNGKALAPNTVRLARSPLSGALKLAVSNAAENVLARMTRIAAIELDHQDGRRPVLEIQAVICSTREAASSCGATRWRWCTRRSS